MGIYESPFERRGEEVPDDFYNVDRPWDESVRADLLGKKRFRNALIIEPGVSDVAFLSTLQGIRRVSVQTDIKDLEPILAYRQLEYVDFCFGYAPGMADWGRLPDMWRLDYNCLRGEESLRDHPSVEDLQGHVDGDIEWIATMPKLEALSLHGHAKGDMIDAGPASQVSTLRTLGVTAHVSGDLSWVRDFSSPGLYQLELHFRRGTVIDLEPLRHLSELRALYLEGRGLKFKNAETLTELPKLGWLEARGIKRSVAAHFREKMKTYTPVWHI